jgi:glycerol uptake operon antiterminator
MRVLQRLEENPIAAAIRSARDLELAVLSQVSAIFILNSDIFNIGNIVKKIKDSGKCALVHLDFVEGLGKDQKAVDYIYEKAKPDGIISTRTHSIKYAKDMGIFTVQRFFLIDSLSYENTVKNVQSLQPDMIEVMPAVMPGVIKRICSDVRVPVIAGGLVSSKEDIISVLKAGAIAVSTGRSELWSI